jgi:hypothetical protein
VGYAPGVRAFVALLLVSSAAHAWDPVGAASVDARKEELQQAWQGKDAAAVLADKLQRAHQPHPKWVDRLAWAVEEGDRRLYFGVGSSSRLPAAAVRLAELSGVQQDSRDAGALDWYLDEKAGVLYALVVEDRK